MGDRVKHKTVTLSAGSFTVNTGLARVQILGVFRQGEVKDQLPPLPIDLTLLNGSNWIYIPPYGLKRITFGSAYAATESETIQIVYKITV